MAEAKCFVIFFDANMPVTMRPHLEERLPYAELIFLIETDGTNGKRHLFRVRDSEVLAIACERAAQHIPLRPYLVTQDQRFCETSGYNPETHHISIFIVPGLTSTVAQYTLEERIAEFFEREKARIDAHPS